MQSQEHTSYEVSPCQCMCRTVFTIKDVRLTAPARTGPRNREWDVGPQHGAVNGVTSMTPQAFPPGYLEPDGNHWPPAQFHPLQMDVYSPGMFGQLSGGYNAFLPGAGGCVDPLVAVGHDGVPAYGGTGIGYGDPFSRCDTNAGGPIHLTTNISAASPQVSFQYLSQEVRRCSVWKAHWY